MLETQESTGIINTESRTVIKPTKDWSDNAWGGQGQSDYWEARASLTIGSQQASLSSLSLLLSWTLCHGPSKLVSHRKY